MNLASYRDRLERNFCKLFIIIDLKIVKIMLS